MELTGYKFVSEKKVTGIIEPRLLRGTGLSSQVVQLIDLIIRETGIPKQINMRSFSTTTGVLG